VGDFVLGTLERLPQFQALDRDVLERLAGISRPRSFSRGEPVFFQGDRSSAFYAVHSGRVRMFRPGPDGREHVVHTVGPGQSFAEAAVFQFDTYPVSAQAVLPDTRLVAVPSAPFLALFAAEPRLARAMVSSLCQRLLYLVQRVEELSVPSSAARLARYVLALPSRASTETTGSSLEVELPMSKKDLALHLAMTPETLSRHLARWRDAGWVRAEGRTLAVQDPEGLETDAERA
jgi:CRP/FNR family transcriptional regulator